jgi:hypothetical protein
VCGYQLAAVEDLYGVGGDARLHFLAQQAERHGIEMLVDLDVIYPDCHVRFQGFRT